MGWSQQRSRGDDTKFPVHLLVVVFGITSWSIMNGLWVELPILVSYLPEGWTLPSYLTIITQFGNIGPVVFSLLVYFRPKVKFETPVSFVIATALTLCALLYSFFWKETAHVAGGNYSVALLALTFTQSMFAATTSMAYLSFMAHLKARYLTSLYIGMGLSGLIPAFSALGQSSGNVRCMHSGNSTIVSSNVVIDVSGNSTTVPQTGFLGNLTEMEADDLVMAISEEPDFSVRGFFLMLFGIGLLSMLSLVALVFHPYCKTEHVDTDLEEDCQLMQTHSSRRTTTTNDIQREHESPSTTLHTNVFNTEQVKTIQETEKEADTIRDTVNEAVESSFTNSQSPYNSEASYNDRFDRSIQTTNNEDGKSRSLNDMQQLEIADNRNYNRQAAHEGGEADSDATSGRRQGKQLTKLESWYLLGLLVWINALQTSFVLAIQVYSSLPYGLQFYHGATKAENIVDPIASFMTFYIAARTTRALSGLTLLGTLFTAYIVVVAAMSPHPFLVNEIAGGALVVSAWIMCTMLMVFSKVSIGNLMRAQGRVSLMWNGASTQLGAMLGAILAYVVINVAHLFKDEPWC